MAGVTVALRLLPTVPVFFYSGYQILPTYSIIIIDKEVCRGYLLRELPRLYGQERAEDKWEFSNPLRFKHHRRQQQLRHLSWICNKRRNSTAKTIYLLATTNE